MKTERIHTPTAHESPRTLLVTVALVALMVTACSGPAPQQSGSSAPAEQAPPQAQPPAPVPQDNAGAPPSAQPAQPPTSAVAVPPPSAVAPPSASAAKSAPVAAPVPTPPTRIARLKAGQIITIRTTRELSTKTMKTGDLFSAILEEPIRVENWVVVPTGARIEGRIVEADDGGRLKGKANLSIELTGLTASDGQKVEIVTTPVSSEAAANRGKEAKRVGVGAGAGAAVGAIAGGGKGAAVGALIGGGAGAAMRGDAAAIPAETVVSFELRSPVTIQERK